jgi:hypothetical protein
MGPWATASLAGTSALVATFVTGCATHGVAKATFVVPSDAPLGLATFETYCGVKAQGARAGFDVDPP